MKLIIQIPCWNEAESLPKTLQNLPKQISGIHAIETLIIDDGSTDGTAETARQHGVNHIVRFTRHKGLAAAFQAGLDAALQAGADIIVNTDADGQYKGEDIPRLVQPIIDGKADIVVGNREIEKIGQFSFTKKRLQRLGTHFIRILTGTSILDATTGFRAYNKEAALKLNIISEYTYTLESIIQAEHKNLAIHNILINTNPVKRKSRLMKSIPEYIKRSIVTIVRSYAMFNPLKIFVTLGTAIGCLGVLLICRFLFYYLMGSGAGKIQSLIIAAVLVIIGFIIAIIGLVSDLIAANRRLIEEALLRIKKIELSVKK